MELSPRNFFVRMEKEREESDDQTLLRDDFSPIFIVSLIKDCLFGGVKDDLMEILDDIAKPAGNKTSEKVTNFESSFLIDQQIKGQLVEILQFAECVFLQIGLHLSNFCTQFCRQIKNPPLELIWLLDVKYNLMRITSYLMELTLSKELQAFTGKFLSFCFSRCIQESNTRHSREILGKFLESFVIASISLKVSVPLLLELKAFSTDILKEITLKLIEDSKDPKLQAVKECLVTKIQTLPISSGLKKKYLLGQLSLILTRKSNMTPEDIIQKQEQLTTVDLTESKQNTIKTFIEILQSPMEILQYIANLAAESSDLDWENILRTINLWNSMYGETEFECIRFFQGQIKKLMVGGISSNSSCQMMASLIFARHCSLIAPATFFRYDKWYSSMFASDMFSPAREPSTFQILTDFFKNLIPFEPPRFIQIHATYYPFIPTGCKTVWNEYVGMITARIQEYNEIEDIMSLEPRQVTDKVQSDVDKALADFNGAKVPECIQRIKMFRGMYFKETFLPALLRKPVGIPHSDVRLRLIEVLNKGNMIPEELYRKYKTGN